MPYLSITSGRPNLASSRTRFTLIELLVVVAVIAILAALLLPVLAKARFRAEAVTCLNQNRQIAIGIFMYIDDFGVVPKRQPTTLPTVNLRNVPHYWNVQVFESLRDQYLRDNRVWTCPGSLRGPAYTKNGNGEFYSGNYMNMINFKSKDPENTINLGRWFDSPASAATKEMESDKLMLAEYIHYNKDTGFVATHTGWGNAGVWTSTKMPTLAVAALSLRGASRIYADGSGFWFGAHQMGANNTPAGPLVGMYHYSHTTTISADGLDARAYWW